MSRPDPMARMNAKLQERLRGAIEKAPPTLKPGETFDPETGELLPPAVPALVGVVGGTSTQAACESRGVGPAEPATARVPESTAVVSQLRWLEPVKNPNGSAHQIAEGTEYVVRKTFTKDQLMYWAWRAHKLLGYRPTPEAAREICEARHRQESTCL